MKVGRTIGLAAAASLLLCMHAVSGHAGWLKIAQGDGDEMPYSMTRSADGSYAIVGNIRQAGAASKWDAAIWKFNARGELSWARSIGGSSHDMSYSVAPASGGGYVAVGYSTSVAAAKPMASLLAKFDASGALQWQRVYTGGLSRGGSVFATSDGGYVFGGMASTSAGGLDALVVKTDGAGLVKRNQRGQG